MNINEMVIDRGLDEHRESLIAQRIDEGLLLCSPTDENRASIVLAKFKRSRMSEQAFELKWSLAKGFIDRSRKTAS